MSFTNAPVSRLLVVGLVSSSIAASVFDLKHYFYILIDAHFWRHHQLWRVPVHQLCYTNSTEVLFAVITLYHMRLVERLWGSQKYASFLITSGTLTALLVPFISTFVLWPLSAGKWNYIPAGPTAVVFAVLAQYYAMVPHMYQYRVGTASSSSPDASRQVVPGLTLSDKSYRYALALHLSLLQWPGSMVGALVGWVVGYMWRSEMLPQAITRWRLPGWLLGIKTKQKNAEYEALRRMLQGEETGTSSTTATGVDSAASQGQQRRRNVDESAAARP